MIRSKLNIRLNIGLFILLAIASIIMVYAVNHFQKQFATAAAEKKSLILLQHNLAIHSYFNNHLKPKIFALTDGSRTPDFFDPTWMSSTYAVREIEKIFDRDSGFRYYYKEAAINARSPQNEADQFEREFIQRLNKDQNLTKVSGVRDIDGKPYFYTLMRGESMEQGCLRCHSTPDKAPANLVTAYGAVRSFSRSVGETVSAVSIQIPLDTAYRDADSFSAKMSAVLLSLLLCVFLLQNRLIHRLVLAPLKHFKSQAESISNDTENLGVAIPEVYSEEMNEIAGSFNIMSQRLKAIVNGLDDTIHERTAELQENEARYRLLFENMTNAFALHEMIYDDQGNPADYRFIEVNPAFELQTGLAAADVVGRTVLEIMPDTEKTWIETYGKVAVTGAPISFENFSEALGRYYQVWAFCPKPGFFATIFSDISERKQSESYHKMGQDILQALSGMDRKAEAIQRVIAIVKSETGVDAVGIRLQHEGDFPYFYQEGFPQDFLLKENSLLARSRDGGICRDEQGNICLECTCGLVLTGKTDPASPLFTVGGSAWTNDSFPFLHVPVDDDPRTNPRNECIHQGFASIALIPVRAKGSIIGLLQLNDHRRGCFTLHEIETLEGMAGNIGEALLRKQAEEDAIRLESELHQAQKMESIGSLAGGVAHDFNNKLSVILGCAHLASVESNPIQQQHYLEEIRKAAEQSADLTRQLLAFARKQVIAPKVINLNETVAGMLKMLTRLIGEDIRLSWQPAADLWQISFDPSQVDQILANLCVNARDSITQNGTITIEISNSVVDDDYCTRHTDDARPGEYVRLAVSDNGCGMNSQTLNHIFEPFFTTKETGKGTGLGLATVFGIVKQNNGFINVSSELGIGTTFSIYLPRHADTSTQTPADAPAIPAPLGQETLLLVEDEHAILNIVAMILTNQGYSVLQASSPAEAIQLVQEHSGTISLLITDVIMPDMNGRELAHTLQSRNPGLKCLFMSGYTADAISRHGVLEEGVHFIQKPFSLPDLASKVREVLDA